MIGAAFMTRRNHPWSTRTATGSACPASSSAPTPGRVSSTTRTLSFDAYDKFIEDDFLHGQRIDPRTDGRPDPRPDVRENVKILGNLTADFDFSQPPRPPVMLPVNPASDLPGPEAAAPHRKLGPSPFDTNDLLDRIDMAPRASALRGAVWGSAVRGRRRRAVDLGYRVGVVLSRGSAPAGMPEFGA